MATQTFGPLAPKLATETAKTANYVVLPADNGTLFTNSGANAAITFTLPSITANFTVGFLVAAGQSVTVTSAESNNVIGFNNATGSSVAVSTNNSKIGAKLTFEANAAGTLWYVSNSSQGNTLTVT